MTSFKDRIMEMVGWFTLGFRKESSTIATYLIVPRHLSPPLFKSRDLCSQSHWQSYWWTAISLNMATSLVISLKCRLALYVCEIYIDCGTKRALLAWHNENCMFNMDRYSPGLFFFFFFEVKLMELDSVQPLKNQTKWQSSSVNMGFYKSTTTAVFCSSQFSLPLSFSSFPCLLLFPPSPSCNQKPLYKGMGGLPGSSLLLPF